LPCRGYRNRPGIIPGIALKRQWHQSSEEKKIGGMLIEGAFKIRQGDFSYSVDGSVGWTLGNRNYYNGLIILQPLLPRTVNMAFTVPTELAQGNFLLALPDGREVNLAVPFRNAGT
jgi:hypothetical protein